MAIPAHITPRGVPYFRLDAAAAFRALTATEQKYAHHLSMASWHGTAVASAQVSAESPTLLKLFYGLFKANGVEALKAAAAAKKSVDADEFDRFVDYAALTYSNMGNYMSFGDSKFVPSCRRASFEGVFQAATNFDAELAAPLAEVIDKIFADGASEMSLNLPPAGTTSYYSADIAAADIDVVDAFLKEQRVEPWNTRVWKLAEKHFEVRIACANKRTVSHETKDGVKVDLAYGDYSAQMAATVAELKLAKAAAANDNQREMLAHYIQHFEEGHIDHHRDSQREWVKDQGPVVETNMGFIETYRDPRGVRGEWEGFVAVVNKEQSKMYGDLVAGGQKLITKLPWGEAFEKAVFKNPDFTSLDVVAFASSGVPLGICIPNYDDIREKDGFKNVYLGNTAAAINFDVKMNHLTDADWELYKAKFLVSMSVNVGIHELLGHGTGKLFQQAEDGSLNFDPETVNPLTGAKVATYYKPGESWSTVFGKLANPFEECRAEAVSLYLALEDDAMAIFGQTTQADRDATLHILWLNMVRAGVVGLEMYTPETQQWRQAHMRARFCILQVLLRAENSIVKLEHDAATDELTVSIDAARIRTDGKAAIGELLRHLNINKALADLENGSKYFESHTAVDDKFVAVRQTVMNVRKPRKQFIQAHTVVGAGGDVDYVDFDPSKEGAIAAMVARHSDVPL